MSDDMHGLWAIAPHYTGPVPSDALLSAIGAAVAAARARGWQECREAVTASIALIIEDWRKQGFNIPTKAGEHIRDALRALPDEPEAGDD